jgi:hypothetical protein
MKKLYLILFSINTKKENYVGSLGIFDNRDVAEAHLQDNSAKVLNYANDNLISVNSIELQVAELELNIPKTIEEAFENV